MVLKALFDGSFNEGNCLVGVSLAAGKYVIRFHLNTVDIVANERR
jgi:hypothetical protein